jgi:TP901 family phage tail tape measure protein
MADTDLGTAKGKIVIDSSDAKRGTDDAIRGIDELDRKAHGSHQGLLALSSALTAVGVAGAAAFGVAINAAADFEETLSGVEAVSGASEKQMESLRKKALQLGADTSFSAGEAALAMEELVKAGLSVDDVLSGAADATVALAAAGEVSLPEAATIAANAMNQFNLSAEDMPRVADLIAGAANASAIDVSDFGMAMSQAGATANLVGLDFADLALSITAMGNAGIKGSDAGTSLKTFLANLQPVTDAQKDAFAELGLTIEENATAMNTTGNAFFDAQGKIKPMTEIAGLLNTTLAGMSEQQKMATLEVMFGSDAIRAAAIIAGEGAEGFIELGDSMGAVTAADVAATRLDNFNGSVEQLKGSLETVAIQIGDMFLPKLRDVVDGGTDLVNKFGEMDEKTQQMAVSIAGGTVALAGLAGGAGLFIHAAAPVAQGIGSIISGVGSMSSAVIGAIPLLQGMGTSLMTLAANPVVLVIAGIVALAAGLYLAYQRFESVREVVDAVGRFFARLGQSIYDALLVAYEWITETFLPGVVMVWDTLMTAIQPFVDWFMTNVVSTIVAGVELLIAIFERVRQFVEEILIPAMQAAWTLIGPIVENALNTVLNIIQFVLDTVWGIIQGFITVAQTGWNLFGDNIMGAITLAFNYIKLIIETVLGIIRGIFQVFTGIISGDWGKFLEGLQTLWDTVWNGIKDFINLIWEGIKLIIETALDSIVLTITTVWEGIKIFVDTILNVISLIFTTIWDTIKATVEGAINFVKDTIETTINQAKEIWGGVWDGISSKVSAIWDTIKLVVKYAVTEVKMTIEDIINKMKAIWDTVWDGVGSAVETAWDTVKRFVDKIIQKVQDAINKLAELPGKIGGALNPFDGDVVPFFARGGIVTRQTLAVIGEAGAEAVIPLTDKNRAIQLMNASGLGRMFMERYADPSAVDRAPTGGTTVVSVPSAPSPSQVTGIQIEQANFYDSVDVDSLMAQAEFATQGLVFS